MVTRMIIEDDRRSHTSTYARVTHYQMHLDEEDMMIVAITIIEQARW